MIIWPRAQRQITAYFYFSLFSLLLIGFSGYQIYKSHQETLAGAKIAIDNYISLNELGIRAAIQSIDVLLKQIVFDSSKNHLGFKNILSRDLVAKSEFLNQMLSIDFHIFNSSGELITSSEKITPFNIGDSDFFRILRDIPKDEFLISAPMMSRSKKGVWIINFSRRILSKTGQFLGIATAVMDVKLFEVFSNQIQLGPNTLFAVVTGSSPHFAYRSSKNDDFIGKPFSYRNALEPVVSGKEFKGVYETVSINDGVKRIVGISHVQKTNMMIIIGKDYDEIMLAWRRQSLIYLAFTALAILIALVSTWLHIKQTQARIDQQMKLVGTAKLASLGEMSAGIAHEINNPLAIIEGLAKQLSKFVNNPEKLALKTLQIQKATERIARIVKGLEKFSRSSERRNFSNHSLSKIVTEVLILTNAKAQRHSTAVTLDHNAEALISCDEVEIEQVMINMINNSIDAIKDQKNKWVKISIVEDDQMVLLKIIDSGPGIQEELKFKLFEPFFTTKPVGLGTGLGLSITKGILDEHKASISINSDSPNTCFEICFPKVGKNHASN